MSEDYSLAGWYEKQEAEMDPCADRIHTLTQQVEKAKGRLGELIAEFEQGNLTAVIDIARDTLNAMEREER